MRDYQSFRDVPVIDRLAGRPIWTLSDSNKRPIDMWALRSLHAVQGALVKAYPYLDTLDAVTETVPDAVNRACYLDALTEKVMVLDIEPECPPAVRDVLLGFPCLYAERSMSGKGFHLLMELPEDILDAYPASRQKLALRHPSGWYEFLMAHYVTFTGNQVPRSGTDEAGFRAVFEDLASRQRYNRVVAPGSVMVEQGGAYADDPRLGKLLELLSVDRIPYDRTAADFDDDKSTYEFAVAANRYAHLQRLMYDPVIGGDGPLTDAQAIWLLYKATEAIVPPREKHATFRDGMPYLMYQASKAYLSKQPKPPPADDGNGGGS